MMPPLHMLLPPILRIEHNCSVSASLFVSNQDLELFPLQLIEFKGHLANLRLLILCLTYIADIKLIA